MRVGIAALLLASIGMEGCMFFHKQTAAVEDAAIKITDVRADKPAFKREYRVDLTEGRKMTITIRNFLGVMKSGELTQPGGRWVLFDPDAPADKILDPALVPLVERYCKEISDIDAAWRKSNPDTFTDESGAVWKRIK